MEIRLDVLREVDKGIRESEVVFVGFWSCLVGFSLFIWYDIRIAVNEG